MTDLIYYNFNNLQFHKPYLLTTACKVYQAYHQKTAHPIDLPIKVYTLWLQAEPSSAYPLQVQQLLAIETGTADQFQSPASSNINRTISVQHETQVNISDSTV